MSRNAVMRHLEPKAARLPGCVWPPRYGRAALSVLVGGAVMPGRSQLTASFPPMRAHTMRQVRTCVSIAHANHHGAPTAMSAKSRRRITSHERELERLLARTCNLSVRTVRDALQRGCELGFIERLADDGGDGGGYAVLMPPVEGGQE